MNYNGCNIVQKMMVSAFIFLTISIPSKSYATRDRGIPANLYMPASDSKGFLSFESPLTIKPSTVDFLFGYNFALNPITLNFQGMTADPGDDLPLSSKNALRYISVFDFGISLGISKKFELSLRVPLYKVGPGEAYKKSNEWGFTANDPLNTVTRTVPSAIPGDTRIAVKYNIFKFLHFASAFRAEIILPFGVEEMFSGEQKIAVRSSLLLGFFTRTLSIIGNISHLYRDDFDIKDPMDDSKTLLSAGQEIHASLGAKWDFSSKFSFLVGGFKFIPLSDNKNTDSPIEALAGVQYRPFQSIAINLFAGSDAGLGDEYGRKTNFRVGAYLVWQAANFKKVVKAGDKDNDGITDDIDACPDNKEDIDKFEDEDGCPDPDNDQDGIPDKVDKCPLQPEDEDGYKDKDGCPDPDNDGDGILDSSDRCPGSDKDIKSKFKETIEDKDNFQDEDGCPDLDNDKDGIPDKLDKCPNAKETVNGIDDNDGCPDTSKGPQIKNGKINIKGKIKFEKGKAIISRRSLPLLLGISNLLKSNPSIRLVRIEGHSDSKGSEKKNIYLSTARAAAVRQYLINKGVSPYRVQAVGYGSRYPVKPNNSRKNRAANRRVEFIIVYQ